MAARYLDAGDAGKNKEVKRHCQSGRHDPGPDGPGLDLTEAGGDFCSGRGQPVRPSCDSSLAALKLPPLGEDVRKEIRAALGQ